MRPFLRNTIFFIGWMLSPLTTWNDALVNIPLSYLLANILIRLIKMDFLSLVLVSYWFTNVLGLYLMYATGREIFKNRGEVLKGVVNLILTTLAYSLILVVLSKMGVLKPF